MSAGRLQCPRWRASVAGRHDDNNGLIQIGDKTEKGAAKWLKLWE